MSAVLLAVLCVVVAVVLFCLYIYFTGERWKYRSLCPTDHQVGGLTVRHYVNVRCERALEAAALAAGIWKSSQPKRPTLWLISDRDRRDGWFWGDDLVINLATHAKEDDLRSTISRLCQESREHLLRQKGWGV